MGHRFFNFFFFRDKTDFFCVIKIKTYFINCIKEILYPCCSATPAHTIFDDDPNKVPFPPKHAPNDNAQINGCSGNPNALFSAKLVVIRIIIVVNGILSTKAEAPADTHKIIRIATASLDSCPTDMMMSLTCVPIQSMRPSLDRASIRMNNEAKNSKVPHSTLATIASMSSLPLRIRRSSAPRNAVQAKPRFATKKLKLK